MKEKYRITKNSLSIIGGICFILFALVILFANNTPFAFLTIAITTVFGFVGYWILLPFIVVVGCYLIFKKKLITFKVGLSLWGAFIMIICFLILSSHWASIGQTYNDVYLSGYGHNEIGAARYLIFSNASGIFNQIKTNSANVVGANPQLGGGLIGFVFAGAINSSIGPVGLNIVCWLFFVGGLMMIFNHQVNRVAERIKDRLGVSKPKVIKYKQVYLGDPEEENEELEEVVEPAPIPPSPVAVELAKMAAEASAFQKQAHVEEPKGVEKPKPVIDDKPIFESFHTSKPINNDYGLKKARFDGLDEQKSEELLSENPFENLAPIEEKVEEKVETMSQNEVVPEEIEPIVEENIAPVIEKEKAPEVEEEDYSSVEFIQRPQPKAKLIQNYIYPSIDLLELPQQKSHSEEIIAECEQRVATINDIFKNFGVGAQVVSYTIGPSVTRYDVFTESDTLVSSLQKYVQNISVKLNGVSVRFEPIVAGKSTSGLEIENTIRTPVTLREAVAQLPSGQSHLLDIPFGKEISGDLKFASMVDFPHMLVAGTTGSGKSIFVHSVISTLLLRCKPEELKLVLIDPKKVEMNYYEEIPHLLCPVISDMKKAYQCFNKLVVEMERRYNCFQSTATRDIGTFNQYAKENGLQPLPYIVVFVDEYADLYECCKEVRDPIQRIVQKARAAGIHMVVATQRPSTDVIDGLIKANFSTRVALMTASTTDSMVILNENGAEKLLGNGDMLVSCSTISRTMKPRVQGCYISEKEIKRICQFLKDHYSTQYNPEFLDLEPKVEQSSHSELAQVDRNGEKDDMYDLIKEDIQYRQYASISHIVRTYGMGYTRAGKIFNMLINEGIVASEGDSRGSKVLTYVPGKQQPGTVEQSTFIPDENE